MYYIIQENLFKEPHFELLIEWMQHNAVPYEIVKFRPFIHEIEFSTDRKDIWCWGSPNMSMVARSYGWYPGSMYNDNHDLEVYGKHYGDNMLNHDGIIMNITDPLPEEYIAFFARPVKDTKSFSGQTFMNYAWNKWVSEVTNNPDTQDFVKDSRVLIAPLKNTQQEVRCWVIGGKVVSASRYKLGSRVLYQNYDDESYFVDFAQKMVDIYQPAEAFVIDVCLCDDELKVVEINCINCSGFYYMNVDKVMSAIENQFSI